MGPIFETVLPPDEKDSARSGVPMHRNRPGNVGQNPIDLQNLGVPLSVVPLPRDPLERQPAAVTDAPRDDR
jgi:hypothetical protein